jgi:hypothetical protein
LGLLAAGIASQNPICDIAKWRVADTRVLTNSQAALAVFTGAARTGVADVGTLAGKTDAAIVDAISVRHPIGKTLA